jgi:hypothetical protein
MSIFDRLLGRGEASVTVPVMDGPFLPNQKLETAEVVSKIADVDNLVVHKSALYASSGSRLMKAEVGRDFALVEAFQYPISALASSGEALAIGLEGQGIAVRGGALDRRSIGGGDGNLRCVTAAAWLNEHELLLCDGSATLRPSEWRRSLMQLDTSGSLCKVDAKTGAISRLRGGMAWPAGLAIAGNRIFVAESWRHRVVSIAQSDGSLETVLSNLPAYPARISPAKNGGYWLSFYSTRNQLVEFILQEPRYRKRMVAEIPEAFWMAPSLSSGQNFKEPMQGSQLKQMGILKPYSASRSYGLVAYCDAQMNPVASFHSRADGRRHGAVACCDSDDRLFVASRGSNAILSIADPMTALSE